MLRPLNITLSIFGGLLVSVVFLASPFSAHAQSTCSSSVSAGTCFGPATKYAMALHAFRLSPDGTVANSVPLAATEIPFDVGSSAASALQQVATWVTGAVVPLNTYTHFIVEIGLSVTVSGTTTVSGGTCTATNVPATFTVPSNQVNTTFDDLGTKMRVITNDSSTIAGLPVIVDNILDAVSIDLEFSSNLGVQYTVVAGICTSSAVGPLSINKFEFTVTHNH